MNKIPYSSISQHYERLFGKKVVKIPVSVVDDCPNRRGLKGMQTCIFCDEWGSAARAEIMVLPLREQIESVHKILQQRYSSADYLVYFQAYTNTFTKITALRAHFETALSYPFTRGLVIGTRPDCVSKAVLDLWNEYHQRSFVSVELGVQSFADEHLQFMRRGHTAAAAISAIEKIGKESSVDLGIHLIFGSPGESETQIIKTAKLCNELPIAHVKLHNLHVLKNTPLADLYQQGEFEPLSFEQYAERVQLFLEHLSPRIAVHRLAALASRPEELLAPAWTSHKMRTYQHLLDFLREKNSFQSKSYAPQNPNEIEMRKKLSSIWQSTSASTN